MITQGERKQHHEKTAYIRAGTFRARSTRCLLVDAVGLGKQRRRTDQ